MDEMLETTNEVANNDLHYADRLNDPLSKLSEGQIRQLRNKFFTVRHFTVPECGHKLDMIKEPSFRNCEYCWFCFFSSHKELVDVTHEAFSQHGKQLVVNLRGEKYFTRFCQYMATLARFKQESDERIERERSQINTPDESGEIQGDQTIGQISGQGTGRHDIPDAGIISDAGYTSPADGSSIG